MIVFENVYECMQSDTLGQRKVKPSTTNNYPYTAAISYYDKEGGKSVYMYCVPLHHQQCIHEQCHPFHNMQLSVDIALSHSSTDQSKIE